MNHNLYKAAAKGEIEPLKEIAKDRELGTVVTPNKNTVLHVNIGESGSAEFVKQILEMCPSLLVQVNAKGDAPLHVAAKWGHVAVVKVLIEFAKKQPKEPESGEETVRQMLGMKNDEKNTALHEAVQYDSPGVVKLLMKTEPDFPYSANGSDQTPLYMAAARGSLEMVDDILKKCPLAAHEGPNGKNALHAAVIGSAKVEMMKLLLEKKKSLNREKDQHGWTSLHHAAYLGESSTVSLLLESDEYVVDEDRKVTALHLAASQGHYLVVHEIIRKCPECYDLVDAGGWNVLHFAMLSLTAKELNSLLKKHPFIISLINDKDVKGNTPLHLLAAIFRHSSYKVVHWNGKGDYEAVNKQNISVEHIVRYGDPDLEREIRELSEDVGRRGQYPRGVIKITPDKEVKYPSFWKYIDQEVIGTKEAKDSHLVVSALIATVTFAAAFTLPGGNKSEDVPNQGTAILSKNAAFQAFVISDAIAMVLSLSAVFVHFILSLKLFHKYIFLFVFAVWFTLAAMAAMIVAFVTGTYAMLAPSLGLAIVTCIIGLTFFFLVIFMFYTVISNHRIRIGYLIFHELYI